MATTQQVQALYVAYFGRPADPNGLSHWSDGTESSADQMDGLADAISTTAEYKASTAGKSLEGIINQFYLNLFNRDADVAGLKFWVEQVANGNTNTQDVGLFIGRAALDAVVPEGETNADKDAVVSKTAAADKWTAEIEKSTPGILAYQGPDAVAAGVSFLQPVVSEGTIPTDAQVTLDVAELVADNSAAPSDKLTLSVFDDIAGTTNDYIGVSAATQEIQLTSSFKFNSSNQIVNGVFGGAGATYNDGDILTDATTTDNDIINLTGSGALNGQSTTLTNIENLNVTATDMENTYTPTNVSGVKNVTFAGTVKENGGTDAIYDFAAVDTGANNFDFTGVTGKDTVKIEIKTSKGDVTVKNGDTDSIITVKDGNATITSGKGDDTITVAKGTNTVNAGAGSNTIKDLGLQGVADTVINDVSSTTTAEVDGTGKLTATATATGLSIQGDATAQDIDASSSTEAVNIDGKEGNDLIVGGSGKDVITGGAGADDMTGGTGVDTFISVAGATDAATNSGAAVTNKFSDTDVFTQDLDIIRDFTTGDGGDTLSMSSVDGLVAVTANLQAYVAEKVYAIAGDYTEATDKFVVDIAGGSDVLVFVAGNQADLKNVAALGTESFLLDNVGAGALADIVANNVIKTPA